MVDIIYFDKILQLFAISQEDFVVIKIKTGSVESYRSERTNTKYFGFLETTQHSVRLCSWIMVIKF